MPRPSSNLRQRPEPPTVHTHRSQMWTSLELSPSQEKLLQLSRPTLKSSKNNGTTILKWGYFLQHLWWICDTGCYKHHTYLKLTGDVKAWSSHIVVIRRRELHKRFMRYICCCRGTKGQGTKPVLRDLPSCPDFWEITKNLHQTLPKYKE